MCKDNQESFQERPRKSLSTLQMAQQVESAMLWCLAVLKSVEQMVLDVFELFHPENKISAVSGKSRILFLNWEVKW